MELNWELIFIKVIAILFLLGNFIFLFEFLGTFAIKFYNKKWENVIKSKFLRSFVISISVQLVVFIPLFLGDSSIFGMSEMLKTDKSNVFENYVVFTIVTYIYILIKSLKIVYSKKEYDKDCERF
jgi:hypothetical protein